MKREKRWLFFNVVGGLKLDQEEKRALTAFLRALWHASRMTG